LEVTNLSTSLRVLVDRPFITTTKYHEHQQRALRRGAHPQIIEFERKFVSRMAKKHGVPMFAHNMVRTSSEQTKLYVQGFSQAQAGESPHNHGCAVDIVHSIKAWKMDERSWRMLGHIGMELADQLGIKIEWGGEWDFYDPAHWQLADWRSLKDGFPF
jgi:hypothetical protein